MWTDLHRPQRSAGLHGCGGADGGVQNRRDQSGIDRAREAVGKIPMRWNLGTEEFHGVVVEFSSDGAKWEADPKEPAAVTQVRVTAPDNSVEITFLRAVGGPNNFVVPAHAAAASNPVRLTE